MRPILLVEDDVDISTAVFELLRSEGYAVEVACNGLEALSRLDAGLVPCLILLDLMMPVMSGCEFLRQLDQRRSTQPPVYLFTAYAEDTRHLNAQGIVHKPVDIEDLLRLVAHWYWPVGKARHRR